MSTDQQNPQQEDEPKRLDDLAQSIIDREDTPQQLKEVCRAVKRGVEDGEIDAT